ncbi:UNVERIFIED_CONTAM: hypothetical protein GTU68_019122 [Idotea baltica]|nr:hypothetical protein [Idotea baltica]
MAAATSDLNVIGNNIANSSTTGFKSSRAEFGDVYATSVLGVSSKAIGAGVTLSAVTQQFGQGNIDFTSSSLDLAINGDGFFVLSDETGQSFTRSGNFQVNEEGLVVTSAGAELQAYVADTNGNLTELSGVNVDDSGVVFARYTNGQSRALGQVALAGFNSPTGLQPIGNTSWLETFSSGPATIGEPGTGGLGVIQSGALEDSNVELTEELVDMIIAQRNFQAAAQVIQTADTITQSIINIR